MIITYTRSATCSDCKYCGYYRPTKKDGSSSWNKRHKCALKGIDTRAKDAVCDDWEIEYSGITQPLEYVKREILKIT